MLAIRMQRLGRSGHAQFRVVVQDSRLSPKSGKVVAYLGSYNPHTKAAVLDNDAAQKFLSNGAQPSDRVARLLKKEGVKLPPWVKMDEPKKRTVRNADKRRSTRPEEPKSEAPATEEAAAPSESTEAAPEEPAAEPAQQPADTTDEEPAKEETPAETEAAPEAPTEEKSEEPAKTDEA